MTSTSTDGPVVRRLPTGTAVAAGIRADFRTGRWTRLGNDSVVGDRVTESALDELAERTRLAAQAEGYAAGWAQGHRAAGARAEERADDLARRDEDERRRWSEQKVVAMAALQSAVEAARTGFAEATAAIEEHAVELAMQIAAAVIGREVRDATDPGGDAVRRALALTPSDVPVTVRLHPDDRAALDLEPGSAVTFVDEATLKRGDAVAETDTAFVDASVEAALTRVREVLTS